MARLNREDILNAKDIKDTEVEVPEWGGTVLVRTLTGAQRAAVLDGAMGEDGKVSSLELYPRLIVAGCVEPEFSKADVEALNEKSASAIEVVAKAIMGISGISKDDVEKSEKN